MTSSVPKTDLVVCEHVTHRPPLRNYCSNTMIAFRDLLRMHLALELCAHPVLNLRAVGATHPAPNCVTSPCAPFPTLPNTVM